MKKAILSGLIVISTFCFAAPPNKAFFCTSPGTALYYERHEEGSGELAWKHTSSIVSSKGIQDGKLEVTFKTDIKSGKMKSPIKEPVSSNVVIYPDGNVELDIAQSALLAAKQRFSGFNFTSTGGTSILPASMKTGDKLEDIHACVAWGGVKYTIDYTSRKVLRRETITVPAGTFDCVVVSEHKVEKAPFLKRDRTTLTWYALGVGMVRHDTFLPNGEMETSEKLNSIKTN